MHSINNFHGNILVIDDTPANLRLLAEILTQKGYKVRTITNGELGILAAIGKPPDLILLDIMMPKMDGYEVCKHLKADEKTRDIPVIFISTFNDVLDKVQAFSVGGVDYITKPFQIEEVLVRVETHLAIRNLQKNLQDKNEQLSKTLQQLQATNQQLIQSEKMAALGQLIAGIAHEVNTPLGAIRSSVENIADFLDQNLEHLPEFFQGLSQERAADFWGLLRKSTNQTVTFSAKEKRQFKRALIRQLEEHKIANSDIIADTLVDLGVYDDVSPFLLLLQTPESKKILDTAYQISSLQKSTQTITTATERAAKVVFALKTYSRYDSTGKKVQAKITEGIETILTLYQNQIKHGVEVIRKYQAELPSVWCYPDELSQVWTNLIDNALQAMKHKGTLTIEVKEQANHMHISISDSGKGIPPENMTKIFDPFFTTKPAGEGSGLGLDIVKKIIEKHQGKIAVESLPDQTTFTISIPLGD